MKVETVSQVQLHWKAAKILPIRVFLGWRSERWRASLLASYASERGVLFLPADSDCSPPNPSKIDGYEQPIPNVCA
ncbi:MAG TPA: hypothetical protein PLJ12_15025, partial [Planctomycetota bacterium]|nr:hypothetical protein [Planctomycetota bacterium]